MGLRIRQVCVRTEDKKRVCPWITGRDRVVNLAHPRAPARRRVGGLEWRRLFGSRRLGDPAHGSEARQLGQAQKRVRGNGLSCGRYGGRPSGNRIGCRLLEAHVDERMTSALEALDPADPTIGRLRALRPRQGRKPSWRRGAAKLQTPSMQPKRRKTSSVYCQHALGRLLWSGRRSVPARKNREAMELWFSSALSG